LNTLAATMRHAAQAQKNHRQAMHAQRVADQEHQNSSRDFDRQARNAARTAARETLAARFKQQQKNLQALLPETQDNDNRRE